MAKRNLPSPAESDANTFQLQGSGGTGENALTLDWEQPPPKGTGDGMVGPARPEHSTGEPTGSSGIRAPSRQRQSRSKTREQTEITVDEQNDKHKLTKEFSRNKCKGRCGLEACAYAVDINAYTALTQLEDSVRPDVAVENCVFEGWLSDQTDPTAERLAADGDGIVEHDRHTPVRDRAGNDMLIKLSEAKRSEGTWSEK